MEGNFNPFSLSGKRILVTGASAGIGQAVAIACSKMGATVVITGRNEERLEHTATLLQGEGHILISDDLTQKDGIQHIVSSIPALDGVVHCAGVGHRKPCKLIDEQDIKEVMGINVEAPILLQAALLSHKKVNRNASIVFMASRAAASPSIGNAVYSASKGALISYAKCLALELAPRLIRANCICPAMIWTDLILKGGLAKEDLEQAQLQYPLKRYGTPDDVANLAVYLLSDASSWMTGSCVDLTGGANNL